MQFSPLPLSQEDCSLAGGTVIIPSTVRSHSTLRNDAPVSLLFLQAELWYQLQVLCIDIDFFLGLIQSVFNFLSF